MSTGPAIKLSAPAEVFRQRRATLARQLRRPLLVCAGHAPSRNYRDNTFPFRAGSTYLYYGGPTMEGAAWLIEPGSDGNQGCTLYRPRREPFDTIWLGPLPTEDNIAQATGIELGRITSLDQFRNSSAARSAVVIMPYGLTVQLWIAELGLQKAAEPELLAVISQRLTKDEHELAAMRRAAEITVAGQRAVLAATAPGKRESDLLAAFLAVLAARQSGESFTSIITVNGHVLHSMGYSDTLRDGALLLSDAGAEEPLGYASDSTRTYPVNGQWSAIQRQLYETVLRAQTKAIEACVPGTRYRDVHDLAARTICEGLVEADLLRGDPGDLAARNAHGLFFCHGLGHLIGLDVHDMEDFGDLAGYAPGRKRPSAFGSNFLRFDRDLEPGMCVTVEPGLYLSPAIWAREELAGPLADVVNRPAVEALLRDRFGGIRIEDTICVRESGGPEVLTAALPKAADEVARLVGSAD